MMQAIEKLNKKLGYDEQLMRQRMQFEKARAAWYNKVGNWVSLDFEDWERDHSRITELGASVLHWQENGEPLRHDHHLIVKENMCYRNSVWIQGNREVSTVQRAIA
jgi:hypothetical protein